MKMIRRPTVHARDWMTQVAVGPPIIRARHAEMVTLNGWYVANPWSQLGIELTDTKADDTKVRGNRSGKDMTCAVSALAADRPIMANPHERE
jgi:hypothetical protein